MEWSKDGSKEEEAPLPSLLEKLCSEASGIQDKLEVAFFNLGCKDKCALENSESSHFLTTKSTGKSFSF